MNPLLSVIITSHNHARFLRECITSALALDYEPKEIIVVDDGSTDGSPDVIHQLVKSHNIQAVFQSNAGQIIAFKVGFRIAKGEVIYLLDSDDVVNPDMMTEVMKVWRNGLSKVQFSLSAIDAESNPVGDFGPDFPEGYGPADVRRTFFATGFYIASPTSGNVVSRHFVEQVMTQGEEHFQWLDSKINNAAPFYGDVVTVRKNLAKYRRHSCNTLGRATFDIGRHQRMLREMDRNAFFMEHGRRTGQPLTFNLDRDFNYCQVRLVSNKLKPDSHPLPDDTLAHLVWITNDALWHSQQRLRYKIALSIWVLMFAGLPKPVAKKLAERRFRSHKSRLGTTIRRMIKGIRNA